MIENMEVENQQATQEPTTTNEATATVADLSRTVEESGERQTRTVATALAPTHDTTTDRPRSFSLRSEKHTLTKRQALERFERAGITITARSIERYCQNGKLDAHLNHASRIYYITPESVDERIAFIKSGGERHSESLFPKDATAPTDRLTATASDRSRSGERQARTVADSRSTVREESPTMANDNSRTDATGERVKQLETQVQTLEIDKRVRDQIITRLENQIRDDRDHFTDKLTRFARLAESFKTRLRLLAAPTQGRGVRDDISDVEVVEASVMGQPDEFSDDLKTDEGKG